MAYLLSDGATTVITYPYTLGMLRRDNPSTSFPASPTDALLATYNMFPVAPATAPPYNTLTQDLNEGTPVTADGGATWSQVWIVTDVDAETIAARTAAAEANVAQRAANDLVAAQRYYIDTLIAGYGFSAEMAAYIAQLEDPTTLPGYPVVDEADWPVLPVTQLDPANPSLPVDVYTKSEANAAIATGGKTAMTVYTSADANVYADSSVPPMQDPGLVSGWNFRNLTAGHKVNWYVYGNASPTQTYGDISSIWAVVRWNNTTSRPWPIVYSAPTGDGDAAVWYHSRWVWSNYTLPAAAGTYLLYLGDDPGVRPELPRIQITGQSGMSQGDRDPSEVLLTVAWNTNSASAVGTEDFTISATGWIIDGQSTVAALVYDAAGGGGDFLPLSGGTLAGDLFTGSKVKATSSGTGNWIELDPTSEWMLASTADMLKQSYVGPGFVSTVSAAGAVSLFDGQVGIYGPDGTTPNLPTAPEHAATKAYVDAAIAAAIAALGT